MRPGRPRVLVNGEPLCADLALNIHEPWPTVTEAWIVRGKPAAEERLHMLDSSDEVLLGGRRIDISTSPEEAADWNRVGNAEAVRRALGRACQF